jgi:hypothetical protein
MFRTVEVNLRNVGDVRKCFLGLFEQLLIKKHLGLGNVGHSGSIEGSHARCILRNVGHTLVPRNSSLGKAYKCLAQ